MSSTRSSFPRCKGAEEPIHDWLEVSETGRRMGMSIRLLKKLWAGFRKNREQNDGAPLSTTSPRFYPVTTGLRIDLSIPIGSERGTPASQFVWVSPAGSSRSAKALRVLLLSN
jgi:hypothetical protein